MCINTFNLYKWRDDHPHLWERVDPLQLLSYTSKYCTITQLGVVSVDSLGDVPMNHNIMWVYLKTGYRRNSWLHTILIREYFILRQPHVSTGS